MKKLSLFTLALAMTAMVACKGKKEKEDDTMKTDTMTTQVQPAASDEMNKMQMAEDSAKMHAEEVENEVFGGGSGN